MSEQFLAEIEGRIGYTFSDHTILKQSLCHSSGVDNRLQSNERLEFLGDSILALVICQHLFERHPGYLEGDLTKMKSMLVSRRICARVAKKIGLQEYLRVGKGMTSPRALAGSLSAGLLEAIIAAIYVDGGLEPAREFILSSFSQFIEKADSDYSQDNYKSLLQQHSQQHFNTTPSYELLDEKGPDHNKCFESQVIISGRHFKSAWGTNKKEAEQKAAYCALVALGIIEGDISGTTDQEAPALPD